MRTVKSFALLLAAASAMHVAAVTRDLEGGNLEVTDVAELSAYDCVTNSSGGAPATLTFNLADGEMQTYAGIISGNIRLVKQGSKSKLALAGANTYTGGTQIDGGVIIVGNITACGDPSTTVTIGARPSTSSVTGPWCALQIDVSNFANPISLPSGTSAPSGVGNTYLNYSLCVTNNNLTIASQISGGFFPFLAAKTFVANGGSSDVALSSVTFTGPITCTGMRVYQYGSVHFRGAVTNSLTDISGGFTTMLPNFHFYSSENNFNGTKVEFVRGYLYAEADDVLNGLDMVYLQGRASNSSIFQDARFYLQGFKETVGRLGNYITTSSDKPDNQTVFGGTASGKHSVLTMTGGVDTVSNVRFRDNMTLVWDPTGDYTFTATSNRTSTLKGPLVVKGGTFELDGGHTMLNVTNITVMSGATLKVSSGSPFSSSVALEAEPGATIDLAGELTVDTVKIGDKYLSAKDFSAGTYKGLTITGAGTLYVSSKPGGEGTYTWLGGGGDNNITTPGNWQDSAAPDFSDESPFIVFAGGTSAVLDRDVSASGITFDGVTAFELSASSGNVLSLGAGGISNAPAASARSVTVSAPVMPIVDQVWQMETNTTFTLSGVLKRYGSSTPTLTFRQGSFADPTINIIGAATAEGASDFAGDIVFEETPLPNSKYGTAYVRASGYEPFGPDGTLKLKSRGVGHDSAAQARYAMLFLASAVISKAIEYGEYGKAWYCAEDNTTNVINGAFAPFSDKDVNPGTFPPNFRVGTNSVLRLCGDMDFGQRYNSDTANLMLESSAAVAADKPTGKIVFDGRITRLPRWLRLGNAVGLELNAVGNAITNLNLRHNDYTTSAVSFGASYALSNGQAMVTFPTYSLTHVDFDLCGTVQHINGFVSRQNNTSGTSNSRISSSGGAGTLRVSQPSDAVFDGYIATNVTMQMEGTATLTFTNSTAFRAGSTLAVSNGTVAVSYATALNEDVALKLMGGMISIPSGQTARVGEAYYLDGNGTIKQLRKGLYGSGDATVGAFFAPGSGSIRVMKGEDCGLMLFVR